MKKILAILLAALMLLGMAVAEETAPEKAHLYFNSELSFDVDIPEGYTMEHVYSRDYLLLRVKPEDPDGVTYIMTVQPDDSMPDEIQTLNDLDEAGLAEYVAWCAATDEGDVADYEVSETGLGTKLVIVHPEGQSFAYIMTYYHGYGIYFQMYRENDEFITDEDIAAALLFNTNFDFVFTE